MQRKFRAASPVTSQHCRLTGDVHSSVVAVAYLRAAALLGINEMARSLAMQLKHWGIPEPPDLQG